VTGRLIRFTTALAVTAVAVVAAVISYRHAYELVSSHGETGVTARLVPFTIDGLILAASMLILDANRRNRPVPPLARWCLGAGILATIGANLAHGLGHGPVGAVVSAWPALALAGSFELLMALIRTDHQDLAVQSSAVTEGQHVPSANHDAPAALEPAPTLEQTIRAWHSSGHSQRAIARELSIDRRKIKRIIDLAG
jgi:peptidoglycan/LPS O-acetylase OafA/YrhL